MIKIDDVLEVIPYTGFYGDRDRRVLTVLPFDAKNSTAEAIMWVNDKNLPLANELKSGILISSTFPEVMSPDCCYITVAQPRDAFRLVLSNFFHSKISPAIAKSAVVAETATIGKDVFIGENVVIEADCKIADNVVIGHNTVILSKTIIESNVTIGSNCTIGGIGFGYEKDIEGNYMLIPHIGAVHLKSNVEIGNNVCIDRAVLGFTLLEENVKVDNQVHIAHGVHVKRNALLIANAMIGGSATIGENVWIAPSSSIINKCTVNDNALIGLGAVVIKNVKEGDVIIGNPGKPLVK